MCKAVMVWLQLVIDYSSLLYKHPCILYVYVMQRQPQTYIYLSCLLYIKRCEISCFSKRGRASIFMYIRLLRIRTSIRWRYLIWRWYECSCLTQWHESSSIWYTTCDWVMWTFLTSSNAEAHTKGNANHNKEDKVNWNGRSNSNNRWWVKI